MPALMHGQYYLRTYVRTVRKSIVELALCVRCLCRACVRRGRARSFLSAMENNDIIEVQK